MVRRIALFIFGLSAMLALTACQKAPETRSAANVPTAKVIDDRQQDFGDYRVLYNALTTDQLTADAARNYGITRSKSQILLNVVLKKKSGDSGYMPISGKVSAKANNLTGQLKNISMREITDGEAVYFIGQSSVTDGEYLTFSIEALPTGATKPMAVTFKQQFYTK
ncbi:MAG: DUF4426 domain-containing protein [Gammaproteobacteria bacterium]|nr:DUF4426 domain-containing protein [Gammaproteobacteria bacterium]